jgi:hypothetical protein
MSTCSAFTTLTLIALLSLRPEVHPVHDPVITIEDLGNGFSIVVDDIKRYEE